MFLRTSARRPAASLAESAITYSVVSLLTLGTIIVGMCVYYNQQTASLAREGARYASVHGAQYSADTGNAMATSTTVYNNAILPMAAGLNTSSTNLTYSVSWDNTSEVAVYNDTSGSPVSNYVHVTVNYTWTPPLYIGQMTFSSTTVMAMQY